MHCVRCTKYRSDVVICRARSEALARRGTTASLCNNEEGWLVGAEVILHASSRKVCAKDSPRVLEIVICNKPYCGCYERPIAGSTCCKGCKEAKEER